jgi:tRNA threonylcarbamoyladenosine biosynthesis protein TsaB
MLGAAIHTMCVQQLREENMINLLALDTSTDACSVAARLEGKLRYRCELLPRLHSQRLFPMLREVLPAGVLSELGIELLAYNHGPGSFTGLRIAASAVQGLAYSNDLPVVGVSTLACMAQGALRNGLVDASAVALVLLDARINEVYWGLYRFEDGMARALQPDAVSAPADVCLNNLDPGAGLVGLGNGLCYLSRLTEPVRTRLEVCSTQCWPDSRDTLVLAGIEKSEGRLLSAAEVQPVYLRNEISWKKLHEQGK